MDELEKGRAQKQAKDAEAAGVAKGLEPLGKLLGAELYREKRSEADQPKP
ncbi:MAG: hypothetical protein LLG14_11225 [Nocardiaceae bacterium]|nr:hypothetical protein [Nocardiaceae bacterium]